MVLVSTFVYFTLADIYKVETVIIVVLDRTTGQIHVFLTGSVYFQRFDFKLLGLRLGLPSYLDTIPVYQSEL